VLSFEVTNRKSAVAVYLLFIVTFSKEENVLESFARSCFNTPALTPDLGLFNVLPCGLEVLERNPDPEERLIVCIDHKLLLSFRLDFPVEAINGDHFLSSFFGVQFQPLRATVTLQVVVPLERSAHSPSAELLASLAPLSPVEELLILTAEARIL